MLKQRGDRGKQSQVLHPVIAQAEIVPGKLSEQQWLDIQEVQKNEDYASEIVDDIVDIVLSKGFEIYLERQLLPYTVSAAKDALSLIVEWNFLRRDESQVSPTLQPGWIPSIEPNQPKIDNWAPRHYCEESRSLIDNSVQEIIPDVEKYVEEAVAEEDTVDSRKLHGDSERHSLKLKKTKHIKSQDLKEPKLPLKYSNTSLKNFDTGKKITKSEKYMKSLTKSSHQESSLSQIDREEIQEKSSPDIAMAKKQIKESLKSIDGKEVILDSDGNIIGMSKLDPDQLPSNRVRIKYHIQECSTPKKTTKPTQSFKYPENKIFNKYIFRRTQQGKSPKKNSHFGTSEYVLSSNFLSLMESIELVPGVKIKDDKTTKCGPKLRQPSNYVYNSEDIHKLDGDMSQNEAGVRILSQKTTLPGNFSLPPITSHISRKSL